jgi:hypothetical protein
MHKTRTNIFELLLTGSKSELISIFGPSIPATAVYRQDKCAARRDLLGED